MDGMPDRADSICFRPLDQRDMRETARVWFESWRSTGVPAADSTTEADLYQRFKQEVAAGWVVTLAVYDGRIVAFMATKPAEGILDQLFVLPKAQGRNIGSGLLQRALEQMPKGFWLRTAAGNDQARRFYEARGLAQEQVEPHPVHGHLTVIYRRC